MADLLLKTKELCRRYNIKPARSRGQNFLIEEKIYNDIVAAADLQPDDIVLEVGPGLGFLTVKLAVRAKKVIAVELDDKLAAALKTGLAAKGIKNVEVVNEDILEMTNFQFPISKSQITNKIQPPLIPPYQGGGGYKIVANLPYNITSIFLRKFLEMENKPKLMVLMLQKEVAERICALPGEMSLLSVSVQFYAKPEIVKIVAKENFWPVPEVDSAIVKIVANPPNPPSAYSPRPDFGELSRTELGTKAGQALYQGGKIEKEFFRLVKFGFSAKRKMLKNNLAAGLKISQAEAENKIKQAGFNGKVRAQELSVDDWLKLFSVFY